MVRDRKAATVGLKRPEQFLMVGRVEIGSPVRATAALPTGSGPPAASRPERLQDTSPRNVTNEYS